MMRVPMSSAAASAESKIPYSPGYSRYVLGTLFCLQALNVMDRQVLATLNEPIKAAFDASDTAMGLLLGTSFTVDVHQYHSRALGFGLRRRPSRWAAIRAGTPGCPRAPPS